MSATPARGGDFLARMAAGSRLRLAQAIAVRPEKALRERVAALARPPALQLSPAGFDLIAEVKRRSPAAGTLAAGALDVAAQARSYARGGAAAISVLTEPTEFQGDLGHLTEVAAAAAPVPAMRKDFLVDPYQVLEARAAGAAGVLLIVAMLDDETLEAMLREALSLGMFVLVELFDETDLARALTLLATAGRKAEEVEARVLLGVNCRDLRTLAVDFRRFAALAPRLPRDWPCVAESGVASPEHARRVVELGYRVALVGTALMRSGDPQKATVALLTAGRIAAA